MPKGDFLLELRSDDMPPWLLLRAIRELKEGVLAELRAATITARRTRTAYTPRRLVLELRGLTERVGGGEAKVSGPTVEEAFDGSGSATPALKSFLKEHGATLDDVEKVRIEGREAVVVRRGTPKPEALAGAVTRALTRLQWPESMVWGPGKGPWIRPLRGILAIFDGRVLPLELFAVEATNSTVGHTTLAQRPIRVRDIADYRRKLSARGVRIQFSDRRKALRSILAERAKELGGTLVEDAELLDRLACSCEIPGIVDGRIDLDFLSLPKELLVSCLRERQSAFALSSQDSLLPFFLALMDRPNDPEGRVRAGREWAVGALLDDVRFHHEQDRKISMAERYRQLEGVNFHPGLGSYAAKAERLSELCSFLCDELRWRKESEPALEAARLLKADVTTSLVREFPEQQGVIGAILAREEGYPETIWRAIYEHSLPTNGRRRIPRGRVGKLVALADRIDTLVGLFGIGAYPKGRDPHRGRALAESAAQILLEGRLGLDLDLVAARAARLYGGLLTRGGEEILAALRPFLDDCVRTLLAQQGYEADEIEAVLAAGETSSLPDVRARIEAIHQRRKDPEFGRVVVAARRLVDVLKDAPEHDLDPSLLMEEAEMDLYVVLQKFKRESEPENSTYDSWLSKLCDLATALERFFGEVLIRDENERLRRNRLALLQGVHRILLRRIRLAALQVGEVETVAEPG